MALAVKRVRRMRGGAQPPLMRCSDGSYYVVKFQNNPQRLRILAIGGTAWIKGAETGNQRCARGTDREHRGFGDSTGARARILPAWQAIRIAIPGQSSRDGGLRLPSRRTASPAAESHQFLRHAGFDKWTCNTNGRQAIFYRDAGVRVSASDPARYSADQSSGGIR